MTEEEGTNLVGPCDDFAMILYKSIMEDENYSLPEKLILCYVRGFDAVRKLCFANSKTIAARFGMADCHVRKIRAGLVAKGKLYRTERSIKGKILPVFSTYSDNVESVSDTHAVKVPCTTDTPPTPSRVPDTQEVCLSDTGGVSNIHGGCVPETREPCTTDTHNKNINININKKVTQKSDRVREEGVTDATPVDDFKRLEGEDLAIPISSWKPGMTGTFKAKDRSGGIHLVTIWYEEGIMRRRSQQISKGDPVPLPKKSYAPRPFVPEKPRPSPLEGWNLPFEAASIPVSERLGVNPWYDKD